jgi:putative transposase
MPTTEATMKQDKIFINKSLRLKEYNYSHPGAYFVTICTFKSKCLFGEVVKEKMKLNALGKIADSCLTEIPTHFEDTEIAEHVIMPNHVHAVVYVFDQSSTNKNKSVGRRHACDSQRRAFDLQNDCKHQKLPIIIGSYKSAVTKDINRLITSSDFRWQTSYHDYIIRNERVLTNICEYIRMNPVNWDHDLENEMYINELSGNEREKKLKQFYKKMSE